MEKRIDHLSEAQKVEMLRRELQKIELLTAVKKSAKEA
jgi:hypothetical protein